MKTIKETRRLTHRMAISLLSVFMAAALTGCVGDDSLCPEDQPGYNPNDEVWLSFDLRSMQPLPKGFPDTRATYGNDIHHPDEAANRYENYISDRDFYIVLLNESHKAFKYIAPGEFQITSVNADEGIYTLTSKINRAYFDLLANDEFMYVLAVANVDGTPGGGYFGSDVWMKSVYAISSEESRCFAFQPSATMAWTPDGNSNRIPMAGIKQTKAPTKDELDNAEDIDNPYSLAPEEDPLVIQRSMIKIRVLDAIPTQESLPRKLHIESVSFANGSDHGFILPKMNENASWAEGTRVLESVGSPNGSTTWLQTSDILASAGGIFKEDDGNEYNSFILYAPEQIYNGQKNPTLRITLRYDDGAREQIERTVVLSEEFPQTDLETRVNYMVRNHIYQFTVSMTEKATLSLDYSVCPWATASTSIDFH